MNRPLLRRNRALKLVRAQLDRKGSPYFILFAVLAATGLSGFLASVVLRAAGLNTMALRYPVCVALAYLVFLFQLFLYVLYHRSHSSGRLVESGDDGEVVAMTLDATAEVADAVASPGTDVVVAPSAGSSSEGSGWLGKLGGSGGGGGDDGIGFILVLIIIVGLVIVALVASVFVLVEAPVLLAEVLVDGVLLAGMAGRLRKVNPHDWVFSVIGRTWLPAVIVAIVFIVGGVLLESLSPGTTTMAEALAARQPQ